MRSLEFLTRNSVRNFLPINVCKYCKIEVCPLQADMYICSSHEDKEYSLDTKEYSSIENIMMKRKKW